MKYDPEKHHRRSIRLEEYDYASPGYYYVTICVQDRECVLGKIVNGKMRLNEWGNIVRDCWQWLEKQYPHVKLDEFVIMPNHMHGIIIIETDNPRRGEVAPSAPDIHETNRRGGVTLPTNDAPEKTRRGAVTAPLHQQNNPTLGQIVAYFKYQSTKQINQLRHTPGVKFWQRNYYEHIIRNDQELFAIRNYIRNNPLKWELDRDNPINRK